jgi:predicted nucleotidyltransferase
MSADQLAKAFIETATEKYGDKIPLIFIYGSYAKGTASPDSDLDLVYVTEDKEAENLYTSFIYDGIGYEFWPIDWERLERISRAEEHWPVAASIIAYSKILWSRLDKDLDRFRALKERVEGYRRPEKSVEMIGKALNAFKDVMNDLGRLRYEETLSGSRFLAVRIAIGCFECLGYANQTYFSSGWGSNYQEIMRLKNLPEKLGKYIDTIIASVIRKELLLASEFLVQDTRNVLYRLQRESAKPVSTAETLRGFYPGIREYVNKIKSAEHKGEKIKSVFSSYLIQADLMHMISMGENGVSNVSFNLPSEISTQYLEKGLVDLLVNPANVEELVDRLDIVARRLFKEQGLCLNEIVSLEEFRKNLKKCIK